MAINHDALGQAQPLEHHDEGPYLSLPLPRKTSIRLLQVHQSSDPTDSIHCSLEVADLADKPEYLALSYTWGPPSDQAEQRGMTDRRCCPIVCNGKMLLITENLSHFLRLFAQPGPSPRPWWIDALCINQDNVLERNDEILKMKDIYTTAFNVVVWLGDADEYTLPALKLISKLGTIAQEEGGLEKLSRNDPLAPDDVQDREIFGVTVEPSDWRALKELYNRRWFARIWIKQEISVAQATIYLCGSHLLEEAHLFLVAGHIMASSLGTYRGFGADYNEGALGRKGVISVVGSAIMTLTHMRFFSDDQVSSLQYAILKYRISRSTDPRDKIYALLGFYEGSTAETRSYKPIVPDYNKSVRQIYFEATQYLLNDSGNLLTLSAVEDKVFRKLKTLPSWVPDYSVPFTTGIGDMRRRLYSASRTLKPEWQIKENSTVLSLNAFRIDTVFHAGIHIGETLPTPWRCQELVSIIADMDEYYINGQTKVEAFWRTLIGDLQTQGTQHPAPDSLGKSFREWLLWVTAKGLSEIWWESNTLVAPKDPAAICKAIHTALNKLSTNDSRELVPCANEISRMMAELIDQEQFGDQATAALQYMASLEHCSSLKFFRTAKGLMGMGPRSMEIGDSIWLAPGAEVFFVLRERHGTKRCEFVGDAYVHGLMHGEALDNADQDLTTVELE